MATQAVLDAVKQDYAVGETTGTVIKIMQANALGTVNINDIFFEVNAEGDCVIDTSSTSAYMIPSFIMLKRVYPLAYTDRKLSL